MSKYVYPKYNTDSQVVDDYFGTKVADPFRWLEDADSNETQKFVEDQNKLSVPYLQSYPERKSLTTRLTSLWDYEKYGCPNKHGEFYYYYYNTGLQNQSILYATKSLQDKGDVFLDPNSLSSDGTVAISRTKFSVDGSVIAYGLSVAGSDWLTVHFKDTKTGKDLDDKLTRVKFTSMEFTIDNKGFFYNTYPENYGKSDGTETTSNVHHKLYYHAMGTNQKQDVMVYECPQDPTHMIGCEVTDDGRYLLIMIAKGCKPANKLYFVDLQTLQHGITGLLKATKIVDNFDFEYSYLANEDSLFTFKTNLDSPNYKIITIDFDNYDSVNWKTLVAEKDKDVLEWASCVNHNLLVLCYISDVKSKMFLYGLQDGKLMYTFPMEIGSVSSFSGKKESSEIFYKFVSFLTPGKIFRVELESEGYKSTVHKDISLVGIDAADFVVKQMFYPSGDVNIPIFVIHKKSVNLDGKNACLLYAYGGFNHALQPSFSVMRLVFMSNFNGVMAIANIRGGGEYGETWHQGGNLFNKQNCFEDFKNAAKFLVANKYSSHSKITIMGGSNGGLLVAACINQSPDLFGAAIAQVGVMDMLRFHKFTIGHAWTSDYGCSDDDQKQFSCLYKYSPIHNVDAAAVYPATLILTADHDDRVVPLHSLKYIALLQRKLGPSLAQVQPLMARIDTKAGHGAGKPTDKIIEEFVDIFSFMALSLNIRYIA